FLSSKKHPLGEKRNHPGSKLRQGFWMVFRLGVNNWGTYIDTKGNINKPLHADYLNNKMKSIRKRHKELTHATPHKLRHTGATLAKKAGMSLEAISKALTHSDTGTTQIYVNTSNVVPMTVGEFALKSLKQ
ncbi:tyrosine-type recombinase/integrase, partial [Streptococcus pneumoniae]